MSTPESPATAPAPEVGAGLPRMPHKRSLRNYLINRGFQLKWIGLILVLTTLLFATLGGYIYWYEKHTTDSILTDLSQLYSVEELEVMQSMFSESDSEVLGGLLAAGTVLILLLAAVGIVLTHKVAGPMYALVLGMNRITTGDWSSRRGFRRGDEFQEVGQSFQRMTGALRDKELAELDQLEALRGTPDLSVDVQQGLDRLIREKRQRIG